MKLIGMYDSPFVRPVAISMKLYGMPYEHLNWSVGKDFDQIRRHNPLGRVPTLVLGIAYRADVREDSFSSAFRLRDQLAAGWSEERIIDYFVTQYGERVLAEPGRKGFTSLVWVLPVIAVLLGLAVVWQVLRSWRSRQDLQVETSISTPQISPEILKRIEQELQEMN